MTFLEISVNLSLGLTGLAMFLALARMVLGPTLPDRVVALDLIAVLAVGFIAAYDIGTDQPVLLDAATVTALIAFLGTVAFAHYLERRGYGEQ